MGKDIEVVPVLEIDLDLLESLRKISETLPPIPWDSIYIEPVIYKQESRDECMFQKFFKENPDSKSVLLSCPCSRCRIQCSN